jgi:alkanesulfonate monooxygenase SsuD/methylene tetrahydromethanopterin reductase-like flavin-dependent oxidoreductase (luciferase family)
LTGFVACPCLARLAKATAQDRGGRLAQDAINHQDRRSANPVFNRRKLKLGTFQTNLDYGCLMADIEGRLKISWPNTVALARLADAMEFEALVPVARWRGFGGKLNPAGPGFETYTWASGIAASTNAAGVVATSHCSINHPIVAAKQGAVIDHISNGRMILNIVTGWNKPEIDMFGVEMLPHDERYDMAEEWLAIVKRLWTEDDEFDHEGKYYKIVKGYLQPKPIQRPFPAIMNAGGSERGRHFAGKYCDLVFTALGSPDFEKNKAQVDAYRKLAREEYDREIAVWTSANIVQAETEAEARRFDKYIVDEKGDWEAVTFALATLGLNAKTFSAEALKHLKELFIAGWGGYPLIGTKEQVVDGLKMLSAMGLDGVLLSWPRFEAGMREFKNVTYPLLVQAGLR